MLNLSGCFTQKTSSSTTFTIQETIPKKLQFALPNWTYDGSFYFCRSRFSALTPGLIVFICFQKLQSSCAAGCHTIQLHSTSTTICTVGKVLYFNLFFKSQHQKGDANVVKKFYFQYITLEHFFSKCLCLTWVLFFFLYILQAFTSEMRSQISSDILLMTLPCRSCLLR